MVSTAIATATLINNYILETDKLEEGQDIYLSMQEFALGNPASIRNLDLCWGYAIVEPQNSTQFQYEINLGRGITRNSTGDLDIFVYDTNYFNLSSLLPSAITFSNVTVQRLDTVASGNVGIGATNPMYKTQIVLGSNS